MIKAFRSRLALKVFLLTALLMGACCSITYACVARFAPYIYSHNISEIEELVYEISLVLSEIDVMEYPYFFQDYLDILADQTDDEYTVHVFDASGAEIALPQFRSYTGRQIGDFDDLKTSTRFTFFPLDDTEEYTLFAAPNTAKESQITEALDKSLPILSVIIVVISVIAAFFYTWYLTRPIKQISRISRKMANLDFGGLCPTGRIDEIGVLSASLNELSGKLSAALRSLTSANQALKMDIDRERQLKQQRREFFSAASHELKTPITIIKGQLQGMLYQVGRYRDRETYLAKSLETVELLEKMVQELLVISRLDAPGYTLSKTEFSLDQLISERMFVIEDLFIQQELRVEKFLTPDVFLCADRQLLTRALDNLLGNAALHSPAGNQIIVKLWKDSEQVSLSIENTGVSIPEEDLPRLFEAFYRVDSSRNRKTGGSGLGLYIAKTILDLHGIAITMENTRQGVRVTLIEKT